MSTTIIPNIDEPLDLNLDVQALYEVVKEWLISAQGDSDKADEVEAVCWYDGQVSIAYGIMNLMQGHNPDYPDTADEDATWALQDALEQARERRERMKARI